MITQTVVLMPTYAELTSALRTSRGRTARGILDLHRATYFPSGAAREALRGKAVSTLEEARLLMEGDFDLLVREESRTGFLRIRTIFPNAAGPSLRLEDISSQVFPPYYRTVIRVEEGMLTTKDEEDSTWHLYYNANSANTGIVQPRIHQE